MSSVYSVGYGNPHIGDQGTRFKCTMKDDNNGTLTVLNLSVVAGIYDTFEIEFLKPNGESVTKTAQLFTDGTDGVIKYDNSSATFLDVSGTWKRRGIVSKTGSNVSFTGSWIEFQVDP